MPHRLKGLYAITDPILTPPDTLPQQVEAARTWISI